MTDERYRQLSDDENVQITHEEFMEGWHYCQEFDGLLVGKGMGEEDCCTCSFPKAVRALQSQNLLLVERVKELQECLGLSIKVNHEGSCEFTDKADEGCFLCREQENKNYPRILAALKGDSLKEKE